MKALQIVTRYDADLIGLLNELGRLAIARSAVVDGFVHALPGEVVVGVNMEHVAEFAQGFDRLIICQGRVAALQVVIDQLLASQFPQGRILEVLGNQVGGFLEFLVGVIEPLLLLKLHAMLESLAGFLLSLGTHQAGGSAGNSAGAGGGRSSRRLIRSPHRRHR